MRRLRALFSLPALVLAAGCVVIPTYPTALPPLMPADPAYGVAPDLSGRYADRGEGFTPDGESAGESSLAALLLPNAASPPVADAVLVTGPAKGLLRFAFFQGQEPVSRQERQEGTPQTGATASTYIADQGYVYLQTDSLQGGAAGIGAAAGEKGLWMRRAGDGSLIVLHRHWIGGIVAIIPFWSTGSTWYRFAPVPEPAP